MWTNVMVCFLLSGLCINNSKLCYVLCVVRVLSGSRFSQHWHSSAGQLWMKSNALRTSYLVKSFRYHWHILVCVLPPCRV